MRRKTNSIISYLLSALLMIGGITSTLTADVYGAEVQPINDVYGLEYNGYPVLRGYTSFPDAEGIKRLSYCYSDGYFSESPTVNNEHLATTSMMLAEFACRSMAYTDLFQNMGFVDCEYRDYDITPTEDTFAAGIGSKTLFENTDEECTLLAIAMRGGAYFAEWANNFKLGESGNAEGINDTANTMLSWINDYIDKNQLDGKHLKFWLTGFSRAGGVSNLLSKSLSDIYGKEQVYGYSFEAPQVAERRSTLLKKYHNIKNYRNYNDLIPFLYPDRLGMSLYGDIIEFANNKDKDFSEREDKMLKQYALVKKAEDEYISPTDFRRASLRLDLGALIQLVKNGSPIRLGKTMSMHDFFSLIMLRSRSVVRNRYAYSNDIPCIVEKAAKRLNTEPFTAQEAMICLGNSFYCLSEEQLFLNLSKLKLTEDDIVPLLRALNYVVLGNNAKSFPQICEYLWNKLNTDDGDYIALSNLYPDTNINDLRSSLPTLLYALSTYARKDYFGYTQTIGTYIYNRDLITQAHEPLFTYCWLRAYDSYYDDATMKAVPTYDTIETEIYAEDGDSLEETTITVRDKSGQELAVLEDGEVTAAVEQAVYVAATRGKNGRIRECAIHTDVSTKNTITITTNGSAEPKKLHLVRRNLFAGTTFCDAPITDMQGKNNDRTDITLYENQEATIHVAKKTTTAEKTIEIDVSATINGEAADSEIVDYQYGGNNKQKNQGNLVLSCDEQECECLAWLVNDELTDCGAEINYVVDLNSPNLIIHLQAEKEHTWENDECIRCGLNGNMEVATVSYHACGGDNAPEDQVLTYSEAASISTEVPKKGGYIFAGWTSSNFVLENIVDDVTLLNRNNVTINDDGVLCYDEEDLSMVTYSVPKPIAGHRYYGYVEQKAPEGFTAPDSRFEIYYSDTATGRIVFGDFTDTPDDGQWHRLSGIRTLNRVSDGNYIVRSFTVGANKESFRKNMMIIDLTEAFGKGNEPSAEWCDENIGYFSGTIELNNEQLASYYNSTGGNYGMVNYRPGQTIKRKNSKPHGLELYAVWKAEGIGSEYQRVEYIESTGTQYIDLGFSTTEGMLVDMDAMWTSTTICGYIIGSHSLEYPYGRNGGYLDCSRGFWELGYGEICPQLNMTQEELNAALNKRSHVICSTISGNAFLIVDGETLLSSDSIQNTSDTNVMLFSNEYSLRNGACVPGRLYSAVITDPNGRKIRELVPCVRRSDGVAGVFDKIERKFYTNDGSDEFKVGNPIRDEAEALPDQYYRLDYVETTGTQYIDTGFIPGENSGIDISFALGSVEDNECFIFGAGGSGHNDNAFELYPWNHKYQVNRGSSYLFLADGNVGEANTEKTRLKIDGEEYSMWDEDGVIFAAGTFESSSVNPSKSLTLFALNRTGGIIQSPSGRIYDCTLYQNGVAVRRLIPCAAKQNGEVGMYDCIEGKFYSCRGKGSLVGDGAVPDIFSLIVDEDGNGYNALTGEELQSGGSVTAEKDIIGYTAVFDGNSYFKYVPIRNKFEKMKEGYTVEFYGSIDELNANTYTCFFSTAENGGMGIEVGVNGKASFYNYLDGKYVHTDRTALDLHRLYHLVGVYDGSSMQFWINGRKFSDIDVTGELSFPENEISQYLCLGGDVNATGTAEYRFKGSIKTANIYSYPLTDKQIEKLYSNYTL